MTSIRGAGSRLPGPRQSERAHLTFYRVSAGRRPAGDEEVHGFEDDPDNREMYRQYLEWDGFRVAVATDGGQAVDEAAALVPTAIVTDLALPRLDGWEAIRQIKADERRSISRRSAPMPTRGTRSAREPPGAMSSSRSPACPRMSRAWSDPC
jgi:CheY-like chemotaxis protein